MKDKFEYPVVDIYSIGKEMMRASQFEERYYSLEVEYQELQKKYQELLDSSINHNNQMMGNFLELAIYGIGGKEKEQAK